MGIGGISMGSLLLILVIAMVIFGTKSLRNIGGDLGSSVKSFRDALAEEQSNEKEKEKLKNLDVLVVNALRIDEHPTHFNLQEALDFVEEIKPKKTYFTHISHKLGFHKTISKQLPNNVYLAFDSLKIFQKK